MLSRNKSLLVYGAVRTLSTSPRVRASHYDVLEITPKATQRDIKAAYYKLSKIYHPDKSKDEAAAKKFRAITEAYEVLGNISLKKMYDKGLLVGTENTSRMDYNPDPEPTDPTLKFYKSRSNIRVAAPMTGRTSIYDFDTWSREHYGEMFQRTQYEKELIRKKQKKQADIENTNKQEAWIFLMFALAGLFLVLVVHGKDDYDRDMTAKGGAMENNDTNK